MSRLSILIPFAGDVTLFEATLASVLQNRPENCEVLVTHAGPYHDPYDLAGEVRFLEQPADTNLLELLNQGLDAAAGDILHVLQCGAEVDEGWTEGPCERLDDDPDLGLVSPLVVDGANPQRIVSRGVNYGASGRRKLSGARGAVSERTLKNVQVLGPTLAAGFYRVDALTAIGGFDHGIGADLADVDVALSLAAIGCRCEFASESRVRYVASAARAAASFGAGRQAERLFWRHRRQCGGVVSLLLHPLTALAAAVAAVPSLGAVGQLLGRAVGCLEFGAARRHAEMLQVAAMQYVSDAPATVKMPVRSVESAPNAARRAA